MNNYLNLVKVMSLSDFKLRYQGSLLGVIWSLLRPFLMFSILYVVFSKIIRFDIENYQLYLLLGIIIWNFFVESTTSSITSLMAKAELVKKINFPKTTIVVAANVVASIHFMLMFVVFLFFMVFANYLPSYFEVIIFLLIMIILFIFNLGVGLLLASFNSRFKDVGHLWEVILQMVFWLTPVVYTIDMIPVFWRQYILKLNPLARLIDLSRGILLYDTVPSFLSIVSMFLGVVLVAIAGWVIFQKRQVYFAEEL